MFNILEVGHGRYGFAQYDAAFKRTPAYYFYGYFRNSYAIPAAAAKVWRRERFDAVFITDAEFLTAAFVLKQARGKAPPIVMQVNAANFSYDAYVGSPMKKAYKVCQREFFKSTLGKEIRALSVLGEWHAERLRRQLRLAESFPIYVIPDCGEPPPTTLVQSVARSRLGLDPEASILMSFGLLRRDKGIENLLSAIPLVKTPGVQVLIAGAPMDYTAQEIEELVRRYGIADRVILRLGYIPDTDVSSYFAACDALLLAYGSNYSGGSGPLLKGACTYGRPVISTDVAEMGRLVKAHRVGVVARPGDPRALAEAIDDFVALSDSERQVMREQAVGLARANSWDAVAARMIAAFRDVRRVRRGL